MSDTKHWMARLVPSLAFVAGIIITSVGGIMAVSSSLKLALFETSPYSFISEDQCRYRPFNYAIDTDTTEDSKEAQASEEEIATCLEEKTEEEKVRFKNSQKENIVDGLSALIVGGILLLAFRKRE